MKLLVVEDERMLCDTIAKSLHHAGYEVDCCYDGGWTAWRFWSGCAKRMRKQRC